MKYTNVDLFKSACIEKSRITGEFISPDALTKQCINKVALDTDCQDAEILIYGAANGLAMDLNSPEILSYLMGVLHIMIKEGSLKKRANVTLRN